MIPANFPEANLVLGYQQDEYEPLPVHSAHGRMTFCCRLSPAELKELNETGLLWFTQLTFGSPFQPISLSTQKPVLK